MNESFFLIVFAQKIIYKVNHIQFLGKINDFPKDFLKYTFTCKYSLEE